MKHAKKAFFASLLATLLCVTSLDSVTSGGNIIMSGTLDVEMKWADGTNAVPAVDDAAWTDASTGAIFNYDLWEPGYTQVRHIAIVNKGTLALTYKIAIAANGTVSDLSDVIDVYYLDPAQQIENRAALAGLTPMSNLTAALAGMATTATGNLKAGESDVITIALKMRETAGNEYQNKAIGSDFSIQLLAAQYTFENDSFDDQYDLNADGTPDNATWPKVTTQSTATVVSEAASFMSSVAPAEGKTSTVEITSLDGVANNDKLKLTVTTSNLDAATAQFTVEDDHTAVAGIDLKLTDANNAAVTFVDGTATVTTYIVPGLDPSKVTVKYNGEGDAPTSVSYDSNTGELVFTTTHFSEFYVDYSGMWYYVKSANRAFATIDALEEYVMEQAEAAVTDLDNKLKADEIIAGYASFEEPYHFDKHVAIYNYLMSGVYGFYSDDWLAFNGHQYTAAGVTRDDLVTMRDQYKAVYESLKVQYTIYPTLKDGFYATGQRLTVEPFESEL